MKMKKKLSLDYNNVIFVILDRSIYRSHIEELLLKLLCDGPVAKPQPHSTWYRLKKSFLQRELQAVRELTEKQRDECSQYIKRWVCIRF